MKKHRDWSLEILINFVHRFLDFQTQLEFLISTQSKNNSWKKINVLVATNQIISAKNVQNSKNQESLRWMWKRQKTWKTNNLRRKRDEDEWANYIIFFYEEWFIRRKFNTDKLFNEKISLNNNDRYWCHEMRFRRWVSCAKDMWRYEH
jgi:hypothetical protein